MKTNSKNPPKKATDKGFTYKSQYGVVVICDSEIHQKETYEKLKNQGYKLKIVCV